MFGWSVGRETRMQNRYVGDVGDYVKLAILRQLARGKHLGVAWWLLSDENHNDDGGHREYLERTEEWKRFDPDVFEMLLAINRENRREVLALQNSLLFPHTVFAGDRVPCEVLPFAQRPAVRRQWLLNIKDKFKGCDLIFLDPDNGVAPEGLKPTLRRSGKSAFIEELIELKRSGQAMVVYHHQSRFKGGHGTELRYLAGRLRDVGFRVCGALRAKPWSARVFYPRWRRRPLRPSAEDIGNLGRSDRLAFRYTTWN